MEISGSKIEVHAAQNHLRLALRFNEPSRVRMMVLPLFSTRMMLLPLTLTKVATIRPSTELGVAPIPAMIVKSILGVRQLVGAGIVGSTL